MARVQEIVELLAPVGGLRKDAGYQQKSPYFAEKMLNARAFDVIEGRGRIGSRPGTVKVYSKKLGEAEGAVAAGTETSIVASSDAYLLENSAVAHDSATLLIRPILGTYDGDRAVAVLYFDATAIPASASVVSATLKLSVSAYGYTSSNISLQVRRLTQVDWVEAQATWDNYATASAWTTPGGDTSVINALLPSVAVPLNENTVLITGLNAIVQEAIDSPTHAGEVHLRLTISGNSPDDFFEFYSSENATAALRPTLIVTYDSNAAEVNNEVRMAVACRTLESGGATTFIDDFDYADPLNPADWTHPTWTIAGVTSTAMPTIIDGHAGATADSLLLAARLRNIAMSTDVRREVAVKPYDMKVGGSIHLFMDMDATTPVPLGSVHVRAALTGIGEWRIDYWINEIYRGTVEYTVPDYGITDKTLRMVLEPGSNYLALQVFWTNQVTPSVVFNEFGYVPEGGRVGFATQTNSAALDMLIDWFSFAYTATSTAMPANMLVVSANGYVDRESVDGSLERVVSDLTLRSDRLISATNRLEKLYIADYELRDQGVDGTANGTTFDDAGAQNWTTLDIDTDDDRLEIYAIGTGARLGVYTIVTVASGSLTISPAASASSQTGVSYRVLRGPKIYDSATDTLSLAPISAKDTSNVVVSQFPVGCRHFSLWADRIVAVNDPLRPHQWFMSAQGYPLVWDYGDSGDILEDGTFSSGNGLTLGVGAAVSDDVAEIEGILGDPIICTIPLTNDYLVFACKNSFHVLRGNPRLNGAFNAISRTVGILDIGAYCLTPENRLYVMTPDGLYEITLQGATPVSRDLIPLELVGLDPERYEVTMGYDFDNRGVLISAVARSATLDPTLPSLCYFFDQRTGGFFPDEYPLEHDATAMVSHQPDTLAVPALFRCGRDGYIRRYNAAVPTDDGTNFDSNCLYGPLRLGDGEYGEGYLQQIICVMDTISGPVTIRAFTGHTAQAALANVPRYETTMNGGRNRNRWPRLRGGACYIDVVGTPGTRWAQESLTVTRQKAGRLLTT